MTPASDSDEIRRKRLLWRATHRGIKEMDIIFGGFVHRGRELVLVKDLRIDTDFTGPEQVHDRIRATLTCADDSELAVEGRVLSLIPLRNRREGRVTRISEGMTEWRCEGRTGYGLSEYLDQIA